MTPQPVSLDESEAALASFVEDALELYGWRWCHFRPARTDKGWRTAMSGHRGFPDIVAAKRGRVLFIELKGKHGMLTPEQWEWWRQFPVEQRYIWYPNDKDAILAVLGEGQQQ